MSGRRWMLWSVLGVAVALLVARGLAGVYTDYLWYERLGASEVWRAKFWSLAFMRATCGIAATLFVFANLYAVRQSVVSLVLPRRLGNLDIGEEVPREQLTYTAAVASIVSGVLLAWSRNDWSLALAARVGKQFGESDPYFAEDLSFFVHRLPFELSLFNWGLVVVLVVIGAVILLYALTPSLRWEQGGLYVSGYVRRHLAMLAGALLLMLSWHYRLQMYAILSNGSGIDGAFTYFDHRVEIPASLVMFVVTLGAGLTVLWAGWTGQMRVAFAALTGVLIAVLAARQVAPFVAKHAVAERDPLVRERPYDATRATYTRRAFAVDAVGIADSTIGYASLAQAAQFVSVWDDAAIRRVAERAHVGAGVSWQLADTALIGVVASGDGQAAASVFLAATADENGTPVRVALPAVTASRPLVVVVADSTARAAIVTDSTNHVAAPTLERAVTRLSFALAMQDVRVLFAPPTPEQAHLVERRTVRQRVAALAPFFSQGSTITPLWIGDTLGWAVDVYATSRTYPLSRRFTVNGEERAYFQHAATAVVNAASGRVVFVADSAPDPVTATWMGEFPRMFIRPTALRTGVREQLAPAIDGARAQAAAFARYGLRLDVEAKHLPDDDGADSAMVDVAAPPIGLPRGGGAATVIPLLDRSERVRGALLAFGGPGHRSVWLAARDPQPLWTEWLDRLRASDTSSAPGLARGYIRVVPIGDRFVAVQPRYEMRGSSPPRLLYVTAAMGDSVRTARTFLALAGRITPSVPITDAQFRARVQELYNEMRRATAQGDWTRYGRAIDALGALLRQPRR